MTRVTRTRSRAWTQTGSYTSYVNDVANGTYSNTLSFDSTITDRVGRPVVPSNMSSTQYSGPGLYLDGFVRSNASSGMWSTEFNKWPYNISAGSLTTTPLSAPNGWLLDVVAGTNPSRPVMTPPTLLQDLIDIPAQIRALGKLFRKPRSQMTPKEISNHYLCVQFGWLPLFDDLRQIIDLQSYILKRMKELNGLYSNGGLRRRIKFASDTQSGSGSYRFALTGPTNWVDASFDILVERRSWATIRWFPTSPLPLYHSDEDLHKLARKLVLGLSIEGLAKGAWDVIPWTWLLGWFSNIGKYTLAFSNTVPASHSEACFMSESKRTYTAKGISLHDAIGGVVNRGSRESVTKTRIVSGSLTPGFNVPFLDTFRLSILGALFTQRTLK